MYGSWEYVCVFKENIIVWVMVNFGIDGSFVCEFVVSRLLEFVEIWELGLCVGGRSSVMSGFRFLNFRDVRIYFFFRFRLGFLEVNFEMRIWVKLFIKFVVLGRFVRGIKKLSESGFFLVKFFKGWFRFDFVRGCCNGGYISGFV